jgi:S1-C subfamily serine protease
MNEPSSSHSEAGRAWLKRLRAGLKRSAPFVAGMLATLLGLFLYTMLAPRPHQLTTGDVTEAITKAMASATPAPAYSALAYQAIQPSLVLIQTETQGENDKTDQGLGSGVLIDDAGDILTCLHVVTNAVTIQLTFADGTQSSAEVMSTQPENDMAVIRATQPSPQLTPATLGNPNAMHVGDEAFVVGNPFGLYGSMSAGIVSGFNRSFQPPKGGQRLEGLIQIDTAVNPGNSGGPLLNRYGQVIGIVVGIVNPTGQDVFIGIGFAVPINVAGGGVGSPPV